MTGEMNTAQEAGTALPGMEMYAATGDALIGQSLLQMAMTTTAQVTGHATAGMEQIAQTGAATP